VHGAPESFGTQLAAEKCPNAEEEESKRTESKDIVKSAIGLCVPLRPLRLISPGSTATSGTQAMRFGILALRPLDQHHQIGYGAINRHCLRFKHSVCPSDFRGVEKSWAEISSEPTHTAGLNL